MRNKKIRNIFIGLGIPVVVCIGALCWLLFTPAYTPKDATFATPQEREQVADSLEQKLSQFQATAPQPAPQPQAAPQQHMPMAPTQPYAPQTSQYYPQPAAPRPSGPPRLVQVAITQREANAMLQMMLEKQISENAKLRQAGLSEPAIAFEDNRVILVAKVEQKGMHLPVTMTVDLAMGPNSTVNYQIRDLRVGRFGLPDDVRAQIEKEMSSSVGQGGTFKLPDGVTGLQVVNGQVILQGVAR